MIDFELSKALGESHIHEIMASDVKIASSRHPDYAKKCESWSKWRLTYEAGDEFIEAYIKKFSKRESTTDFDERKALSYNAAFAKDAVNEVKDSIFQRISDVTREGGEQSFLDASLGLNYGIDRKGSSMNSFVGRNILPELLALGRVGVFVDMPELQGPTMSQKGDSHPYIYHYKTEDILNWVVESDSDSVEFQVLLLRDYAMGRDEATGLPTKIEERFRYLWRGDGCIYCHFFDKDSKPINRLGQPGIDVQIAQLPSIPFTLFTIFESLMTDIANYQITLMNLASADISYLLRANFPFYVEQFDPKSENFYQRRAAIASETDEDGSTIVYQGTAEDAETSKNQEIAAGPSSGRRIPKGLDMPAFIHPSSEPVQASMAKQDELKRDIKALARLAVSSMRPTMASAESKGYDERSLEAGLSAIGLELEQGERNVARFWTMYENLKGTIPTIRYPTKYSLRTDNDRREEAEELRKSMKNSPSITYQREALKQIVNIDIAHKVSLQTLKKIEGEIDSAKVIFSDPDVLKDDVEMGLIDPESASGAKNYPKGVVEKAKIAHAERATRILEAQTKARGVDELGGVDNASKDEKQEKTLDTVPKDETRGEGK